MPDRPACLLIHAARPATGAFWIARWKSSGSGMPAAAAITEITLLRAKEQ
jgi:hypothetical protein